MRFLIQALVLVTIFTCFPSRGQACCDEGWLSYGNPVHCYFFNHDASGQADWHGAVQTCRLLGGHLLDIRNEDERLFVRSHLKPGSTTWSQYLIGMSKPAGQGSWKYVDGTAVTFLKWKSGEPNGGTKENCAGIFSNQAIGQFNDTPCSHKHGRFICKKRAA